MCVATLPQQEAAYAEEEELDCLTSARGVTHAAFTLILAEAAVIEEIEACDLSAREMSRNVVANVIDAADTEECAMLSKEMSNSAFVNVKDAAEAWEEEEAGELLVAELSLNAINKILAEEAREIAAEVAERERYEQECAGIASEISQQVCVFQFTFLTSHSQYVPVFLLCP